MTLDDWRSVGSKRGAARLGFAVLLKFFEVEARFPEGPDEVPVEAVVHVAEQVGVDWRVFDAYGWRGRTIEMHRSQIRARFGFRPATDEDAERLGEWLVDEIAPSGRRVEAMVDAVVDRCRRERMSC